MPILGHDLCSRRRHRCLVVVPDLAECAVAALAPLCYSSSGTDYDSKRTETGSAECMYSCGFFVLMFAEITRRELDVWPAGCYDGRRRWSLSAISRLMFSAPRKVCRVNKDELRLFR